VALKRTILVLALLGAVPAAADEKMPADCLSFLQVGRSLGTLQFS
jgi:hypothetical protein